MTLQTTPPLSRAVIIAVGAELLTPHRVDTNSLELTTHLNALGIEVCQKLVVGDDREDLADALRHAMTRGNLVIITGGLGPTDDDVTRAAVAGVLELPLEEDPQIVDEIRARFAARGLDMPDINRRQALAPKGGVMLANRRGTAPGLWIERDATAVLLLPGPPRELGPMFEAVVRDRLASRGSGQSIYRRVLRITGRTESHVEEAVQPLYSKWQPPGPVIKITILAAPGQIELHLSTKAAAPALAGEVLDAATAEFAAVLGEALFSTDGSSLEEVVGRLLREQGGRVAVAESCTGGLITSRLTDVPGSSAYVHAGWTLYDNDAKVELLGVDPALIREHGAVSGAVAEAMAMGARERAGVTFGLGVTGIAGPGGGTTGKPLGTVCVAVAGPGAPPKVRRLRLSGERTRVKFQASQVALDLLRRALQQRSG